jgi:peroxiredoxin
LYVVFESPEAIRIDTVTCKDKGQFFIFREQDEDVQVITIYYNDRSQWFTVYPEVGKPVRVKGDAHYPQLLQIKGGRINDKLSEYKKKASPLLRELADLQSKNISLDGEETIHQNTLNLKLQKIVQDFIEKNPKEEASAVLVSDYYTNPDEIKQTESLLNLLSPELNDFYLVKNLRKEIEKIQTTNVGAKAPNFKVTNIYGQTYSVDSLSNKHFILAFTALWCDMCQTEVMKLNDITDKYAKDSLEILLICLDDNLPEIRDILCKDTIQWNLVADSAGQAIQLFELYNVNSLPKCFLMDKEGVIMLNTRNGEELKQKVDEVMND